MPDELVNGTGNTGAGMEGVSKFFIIASLFYLVAGTSLGFLMAFKSGKWVLRLMPAHAHINLLGWVSMLIFGFAYYLVPMAAGRPMYSHSLPYVHFALANTGLVGMAVCWVASRFPNSPVSPRFVWPFGLMVVVSLWLFMFNVVMTLFA